MTAETPMGMLRGGGQSAGPGLWCCAAVLSSFLDPSPAWSNDPRGVSAHANPPFVLLLHVAGSVEDALWYEELRIDAEGASRALGVRVEHFFAGTDRPRVLAGLRSRLAEGHPRPNYVVFANQRDLGPELLAVCDELEVDAFLFSAPLRPEDAERLGGPRGRLKHWIGELIPDDERAGYDLAKILIQSALGGSSSPDRRLRMLAIGGLRSTTSARSREAGLRRALGEHPRVELLQMVSARWKATVARRKYELLRGRYGPVDIVWAANDPMALGVIESSRMEPVPPLVGGIEMIPPAIRAVRDGHLTATLGGYSMDIAFVLALLSHHARGIDFAQLAGTPSLKSTVITLTASNVDEYADFFTRRAKRHLDYERPLRRLSRAEALRDLSIRRFLD